MTKQVIWTNKVLQAFIVEGNLSEDEILIMTTRAKGWTITQQSLKFNMSKSKIDKIIARLKVKYDIVQKDNQDTMPVRRSSAEEVYMDNN